MPPFLRRIAQTLFVSAVASFCALAAPPSTSTGPQFSDDWSPEDCGVFKLSARRDQARCGYVAVPLRHGEASSPRIRLAVVVIPAASEQARQADPLFLAQGGPGGSTIGSFAQVLLDDASKRPVSNRDLVLWDQRGTYFSQPRLVCRETGDLPDDADDAAQLAAMHRCGQRLQRDSGDLSAFNSLENARDVDAVRAALGYTAFHFYGVSYGTELGQFLMRERPAGLRAVVLDAVVPLGFSLITDVPAVKQGIMQRYAESCLQTPSCEAAYPDLGPRYLALLDRLDKAPVPIGPGAAAGSAKAPAAQLTGRALDEALYQSLYQRESVALITYVVHRAEQGDFSFAANFVQLMQASEDDMANGMYMAVVCAEYGDTDKGALRYPGLLPRLAQAGATDAQQILALCRNWNIRLLDKALLQPVRSDIPTLLLSGRFDPITPPEQADRVAAGLSRAYRFTFPAGTHGQAFSVPCANELIGKFLDAPDRAPEGACLNEAPPRFLTPDQLVRLPTQASAGASVAEHVRALAAPAMLALLAIGVLFTAVPVYSVAETVRVFRRQRHALPEGWQGRLIGAAPWLPVLAGILLLGFLLIAGARVSDAISANQMLLLVGALPAWVTRLGWGLVPFALVLVLMTQAMVLLWRYRTRGITGRVYYTLLVLAGWGVLAGLLSSGLLRAPH